MPTTSSKGMRIIPMLARGMKRYDIAKELRVELDLLLSQLTSNSTVHYLKKTIIFPSNLSGAIGRL